MLDVVRSMIAVRQFSRVRFC